MTLDQAQNLQREMQPKMDDFTLAHLNKWLAGQVRNSDDVEPVRAAMLAEFVSDPYHWEAMGWPKLYDAVSGWQIETMQECRRELAMNFECPSEQILGVYGAKLGLTSRQMYDKLTEGL